MTTAGWAGVLAGVVVGLLVFAFLVWRRVLWKRANALARGRLGTWKDAKAAGLTVDDGPYLGMFDGKPLHYNGDGHLLTYGRTGSGKGQTVILPNLAMLKNRSVVVTDPKGENARASAYHRQARLGSKVVFVNPWGVDGWPSVRINPLSRLNGLARKGALDTEAFEVAQMVHPLPKGGGGENAWVTKTGQVWIATRLRFMATVSPSSNTLCDLWEFFSSSGNDFAKICAIMNSSQVDGVVGIAGQMGEFPKQNSRGFSAIISELLVALSLYATGTTLSIATAKENFDVTALKVKPHTVFVIVPADKMMAVAPWLSLLSQHILESVARGSGDVRTVFLLDEFANLPRMPVFEKALRLYRGFGVQFWVFVQGRHSLRGVYGQEIAKDIEDQAEVLQMFGIEDAELLRDVGVWSGGREIVVEGASGSEQRQARNWSEQRQRQPNLYGEDIRTKGVGEQILRLAGWPLFEAQRMPVRDNPAWQAALHDPRLPVPQAHLAAFTAPPTKHVDHS